MGSACCSMAAPSSSSSVKAFRLPIELSGTRELPLRGAATDTLLGLHGACEFPNVLVPKAFGHIVEMARFCKSVEVIKLSFPGVVVVLTGMLSSATPGCGARGKECVMKTETAVDAWSFALGKGANCWPVLIEA